MNDFNYNGSEPYNSPDLGSTPPVQNPSPQGYPRQEFPPQPPVQTGASGEMGTVYGPAGYPGYPTPGNPPGTIPPPAMPQAPGYPQAAQPPQAQYLPPPPPQQPAQNYYMPYYPPQQPAPPAIPPTGYGYSPADDKRGIAITALVLGIVSIVLSCWPILSVPCGVVGIILGCLGLKSTTCRGMAIAGIVCGGAGLAIMLFWILTMTGALWNVWDYNYWY